MGQQRAVQDAETNLLRSGGNDLAGFVALKIAANLKGCIAHSGLGSATSYFAGRPAVLDGVDLQPIGYCRNANTKDVDLDQCLAVVACTARLAGASNGVRGP